MALWIVWGEPGPAWDTSKDRRDQLGWDQHAEFMDGLVESGFVVLGGPVGDGWRVLHVCEAGSEAGVRSRLAEDPWPEGLLATASGEPGGVLVDGRQGESQGRTRGRALSGARGGGGGAAGRPP